MPSSSHTLLISATISLDASCAEAHLMLGYIYLRGNKLDEALKEFQKSSALDRSDPVSICMTGYALEKAGKHEEAIAKFESMGGVRVEFDYSMFDAAAKLLYAGPWLAERYLVAREHGFELALVEPVAVADVSFARSELAQRVDESSSVIYSDAELKSFADAAFEVKHIKETYLPKMEAAENEQTGRRQWRHAMPH